MSSYYKFKKLKNEHDLVKNLTATVSHEMMTPLNCISTFADCLGAQLKEPEHKKIAMTINRTSKLLKLNLRDLLDRNLLERGLLTPNLEAKCLKELLEEVLEMVNYQADSRNIKICFDYTGAVERKYLLDI